jgi:hypothetical protein
MPVFLASPSAIQPGPPGRSVKWRSSQHTWEGWDGSLWDLSGGTNGVKLLAGVRGMHAPPVIRYATKTASRPGSLYRGGTTDERDVFWPVKVFQRDDSKAWIEHNRRWWSTLDPDITGLWSVIQPSGEKRSLRCRFVSENDDADETSPELRGWAHYFLNLVAEQPYWMAEPKRWGPFQIAEAPETYYGGSSGGGFGPDYYVMPASTLETATITNDGDVPTSPVWRVNGPSTFAQVGLDDHLITFPIALTEGQWLTLDTDPGNQVLYDQDGNDRTAELGLDDFWDIPKGASVPLSLDIVGTGSIEVTTQAKFRRAV